MGKVDLGVGETGVEEEEEGERDKDEKEVVKGMFALVVDVDLSVALRRILAAERTPMAAILVVILSSRFRRVKRVTPFCMACESGLQP
jgi:hypothetical protein